jgi:type VI secretion system secreted protein Hcp
MKYMYLTGQKSGAIKGSVTQKGRENSSIFTYFDFGVQVPTDQMTGFAAGKRRHQPLTIRKEIDVASPLIFQMACNNEVVKTAVFKFWKVGTSKTGVTGQEQQYLTITLTNAHVTEYKGYTPESHAADAATRQSTWDYEEIQFTYQKIEYVWTDGGISAMDDWEAPVV